jgi:predicted transcriptional regulator
VAWRHLRIQHRFEPPVYDARWKLPANCSITAPIYSARSSTLAKELGLGRLRQVTETAVETNPASCAKTTP